MRPGWGRWRRGRGRRRREWRGSCVSSTNWTSTAIFAADGPAVAVAAQGATRAMIYKRPTAVGGGAIYAECSNNCQFPAAWSTVPRPDYGPAQGGDLVLETLDGGVLRRTAVWGGDSLTNPSPMILNECTGSSCAGPQGWSGSNLPPGVFPRVVIDRAGLPVVFSLSTMPFGLLQVSRCLQRPCVGANWTTVPILPAVSSFTAGSSDAGVWAIAAQNRLVTVTEIAGGWAFADFGTCTPAPGDFPSADRFSSPNHAAFTMSFGMWLY